MTLEMKGAVFAAGYLALWAIVLAYEYGYARKKRNRNDSDPIN